MTPWTPKQDATLRTLYATQSASEIALAMGRNKSSIKNRIHKLGLKKPPGTVNRGRFTAGQKSWNKGMKGLQIGGIATQFKPGNLSGRAAEKKRPLGDERVNADGYLQRKVNEDPAFHHRWKFVHIIMWEEAHGPVPKGHAVVFKNGDRTDIRLDNLECISRSELMRRNTVHNYPPELVSVIRMKAGITKRISTREKKEQHA